MTDISQLREQLAALDNNEQRQQTVIAAFNEAEKAGDNDTCAAIAEHIIGEEILDERFSPGLQMYCLQWLTDYHAEQFVACYNDENASEDEKNTAWQPLMLNLWQHKWVIAKLAQDLGVEKERLTLAGEIMRDRYDWAGLSQSAVHKTQMLMSMDMGDVDAAKAHYTAWQETEADDSADCPACEQTELVNYHHFIGQYQKAVELAAPILAGELTCAEVPHITYYPAISSMIHTGDWARAAETLNDAVQLIENAGDEHIHIMPRLIQLKNRLGEHSDARALFDKHSDAIYASCANNSFTYLQYLTAAAPYYPDAAEHARTLAEQYDNRNGNHYFRNQIASLLTPPTLQ